MTGATHLHFLVLMLCGLGVCSAMRHVAVVEGQRLLLSCLKAPGSMDWTRRLNNNDMVLFLNDVKGYDKENKYNLHNFSSSEYTLSVYPVTFKDEGIYICHTYGDKTTTRRYNVTVLGEPQISSTKHQDRTLVKCSVRGNTPALDLSWQFGNGIHLEAQPQHLRQESNGRWTSEISHSIQVLRKRVVVKCILRNPTLPHAEVRFITLENTKTRPLSTQASKTEATPTDIPSVSKTTAATGKKDHTQTVGLETSPHPETSEPANTTSPLDNTNTTLINTSLTIDNSTRNDTTAVPEGSREGSSSAQQGSASLFITSVTFLILCLLIVVTFLVVKLRREQVKWKLEKEESDQSVESGKSKSSGEDNKPKISLGFLKSNFRKYRADKDSGLGTPQASASTSASDLEAHSASASAPHSASHSTPARHSASHTVEVTVENHSSNSNSNAHQHTEARAAPVKETEL